MDLAQRVAQRYAAKKPEPLKHPIDWDEKDEVIKALNSCYDIMKSWTTRTSLPAMYEFTPELRKATVKMFHDLQDLTDDVRNKLPGPR
jgi:hypothetical protein